MLGKQASVFELIQILVLCPLCSKKKRMKIDPSAAGNNRTLYDEEGNTLDPLAALSRDRDEPGVDNRQRTMNLTAAER